MKPKIILIIAALALLCLAGWSGRAQRSSRTAWEYKVISVYGTIELAPPSMKQFNDAGEEGWELVMVRSEESVRGGQRQIRLDYYFKRQV